MKKLKALAEKNKPLTAGILIGLAILLSFYFYTNGADILLNMKRGFMDGWNGVECNS